MYRTVLCLLGFITLAFSCGSKDDESSASDWSDTGGYLDPVRDSGAYYDSDDAYYCMVIAETCESLLDHYASCDGIDADMVAAYEATLEAFSDDQCAAAADSWAAAGCCDQY